MTGFGTANLVTLIFNIFQAKRYLDDLLNIDNTNFEQMVQKIYPAELQLKKANAYDTEAAFFRLKLINS